MILTGDYDENKVQKRTTIKSDTTSKQGQAPDISPNIDLPIYSSLSTAKSERGFEKGTYCEVFADSEWIWGRVEYIFRKKGTDAVWLHIIFSDDEN